MGGGVEKHSGMVSGWGLSGKIGFSGTSHGNKATGKIFVWIRCFRISSGQSYCKRFGMCVSMRLIFNGVVEIISLEFFGGLVGVSAGCVRRKDRVADGLGWNDCSHL